MLYNKAKYHKINDKKVLHKKGKRWITVSAALLGMIGVGAATGVTTHADTNAGNQNAQINRQLTDASASTTQTAQSAEPSTEAQASASTAPAETPLHLALNNNQSAQSTKQSSKATFVHVQNEQKVTATSADNNQTSSTVQSNNAGKEATNNTAKSAVNSQGASSESKATKPGSNQVHTNLKQAKEPNLKGLRAPAIKVAKSASANKQLGVAKKIAPNSIKNNGLAKTNKKLSAKLNNNVKASAQANLPKFNNGLPNVDGNNVTIAPVGNTNNNSNRSDSANAVNKAKQVAMGAGKNNNENTTDPFESDPYTPVLTFSYVNTANVDQPVGHSVQLKAHAGEQFSIDKLGTVHVDGKTVEAPKGYAVDPFGDDDTYTDGNYTVLPRIYTNGSWDNESYVIGVEPESQLSAFDDDNVSEPNSVAPKSDVQSSVIKPAMNLGASNPSSSNNTSKKVLLGGANNADGNNVTHDDGDDGGDNNNNNATPQGSTVNNNDHNEGWNGHDDSAAAALINAQDRDAQDTMNRMVGSESTAMSQYAQSAASAASLSAQAVTQAESGKDAATIQSLTDSASVQSMKNSVANSEAESSMKASDVSQINQFKNQDNSERAALDSAGNDALNELANMNNLTPDEYTSTVSTMQSGESTYLSELANAQSPAQYAAITNDFLSTIKSTMADARDNNNGNSTNSSNSAQDTINSETAGIYSLLDNDSLLNPAQRSNMESTYNSDASIAQRAIQTNSGNQQVMSSALNTLGNDIKGLQASESSEDVANSNASAQKSNAQQSATDSAVVSARNSEVNSVNNNPDFNGSQKAIIISQINSTADVATKGHIDYSSNANSNASFNNTIAGTRSITTGQLNSANANDQAYINANPYLLNNQKSSMDTAVNAMASAGINALDNASDVATADEEEAIVKNKMDSYSGNSEDNVATPNNNTNHANNVTPESQYEAILNAPTLAQAQQLADDNLNNADLADKAYVNGNPELNDAQKSSMDINLDHMAEEGNASIDVAPNNSSANQILANTQNAMARYSGNLSTIDYSNPFGFNGDPDTYNPYAFDDGLDPYGNGLTSYDPAEWNFEANLVANYQDAFRQGLKLDQLPFLNNQAFNDGVTDAEKGFEAFPGLTNFQPYRDGYNAYTSGYNDGKAEKPLAKLYNYGTLYQGTYFKGYHDGEDYTAKVTGAKKVAFKNGYQSSRNTRLAVTSLEGHSKQFIEGYIEGMNDRLKNHPDYLILHHTTGLYVSPKFSNKGLIRYFHGGDDSKATEVQVNGVSVDSEGNLRYHVISTGLAGSHDHLINGWISANQDNVSDVYYRGSDVATHGDRVMVTNPVAICSQLGGGRIVKRLHRGQTVKIQGIVRLDGITRFYVAPHEYLTSNKRYVQWLR